LRALAHWGEGRLESMPEVPSLKELGYDTTFSQWAGIFVPAGTPQAVVTRLRDASRQAAGDERLRKAIETAGSPVLYLDAPQFGEFVAKDATTMKTVVDRIGKQ
jgi:tripartite-type tricarboxylate transporter receptor subunit TctC